VTGFGARVLVLVTVLLTACTLNGRTATNTPKPSPHPSKIAWTDCGGGFQCGSLQVPLDYSNPEGKKITLALLRKPASQTAKRIGSLLANPGGPGESGIDFLRSDAHSLSNLNQRFDLVTWDPRGVAGSSPVTCVSGAQLDQYLALDSVLDDPQEKQAQIQAIKDFAAACQEHSGEILPFLDSASTANDMDQIRQALGDEKLTYLGFSYGTFIGQWYAHLFPTRIRALSLDGVVDPTVAANDALLGQVAGFEKNLQAFLSSCRLSSTCAYARSGDPGTKLTAAMARLDSTPLRVGNRQLTRSLAMTGVLVTLYNQSFWTYLDLSLTALDQGDGSKLLLLADAYNQRHSDGTYDNLFNGAYQGTYCLDFAVPTDIADYDRLGPAFARASPLFGPWSQYSNLQCAYWPVKPKHNHEPLTVDGAPPILLVGGTDDPATPYAEAQSVNQQIPGSVLLTRMGNGHTSYDSDPCSHAAEDAYLVSLTLPAPGTVCTI
jgi:pimeloyl-ACP methyl ester carboxylesterase